MSSTLSTTFNPAAHTAASVLDAIADPAQSLADIAKAHNCTIEAITLWMTSDGIRERFIAAESTHAWRTRLCATAAIPQAMQALVGVLNHPLFPSNESPDPAHTETDRATGSPPPAATGAAAPQTHTHPTPLDTSSGSLPTPDSRFQIPALLRHRAIETVRKAATTILRLTTFRPLPYNAGARPDVARAYQPMSAARQDAESAAPRRLGSDPAQAPEITQQDIDNLLSLLADHLPPIAPDNGRPPADSSFPVPAQPPTPAPPAPTGRATEDSAPAQTNARVRQPTETASIRAHPCNPRPASSSAPPARFDRAAHLIQSAGTASPRGP